MLNQTVLGGSLYDSKKDVISSQLIPSFISSPLLPILVETFLSHYGILWLYLLADFWLLILWLAPKQNLLCWSPGNIAPSHRNELLKATYMVVVGISNKCLSSKARAVECYIMQH